MKFCCSFLLACFFVTTLPAQNVGVNTPTPIENLQVDSCIKVGKNATLTGAKKNIIKFGDDAFVTIGEEVGDDKMYLRYGTLSLMRSENSIGNGFMGIQTETPTNTLDINGSLRLRGNGAAAGKVLTSDANGVASWSGPVAMSANTGNTPMSLTGAGSLNNIFRVTEYQTVPGLFSAAPSRFTALITGIYHFSGSIGVYTPTGNDGLNLFFNKSDGSSKKFGYVTGPTGGYSLPFAFDIQLDAGEFVNVLFFNIAPAGIGIAPSPNDTFWSVHLVK